MVVGFSRGFRVVRGRAGILMEGTGKGRVVIPKQDARASEMYPMFGFVIALNRGLTFGYCTIANFTGVYRRTRVLLYISP